MDKISLKAMGKINLALDVLGRRENGYHDVRMIMQSVQIYDRLTVLKKKEPGITVTTNRSYLPTDHNNLVYQAAKLLIDEFQIKEGIHIELKKFLPVAAGMAGGSSDAAAVLYGMNRMFRLGLGMEELMKRGVTLGADIPFCIMRGTVLAEGIGEILTPLKAAPPCHVLIAKPGVNVSTKYVYEQLDSRPISEHPDIDGMIDAIDAGDFHAMTAKLGNVLENVTKAEYPLIGEIERIMLEMGAAGAAMSGSGPTVFGLFEEEAAALAAYDLLKGMHLAKQIYLTQFYQSTRRQEEEHAGS
ncbi:MAG: 4-(cytidine 5'-diphospho)-2-C-methyl-D-erythritol kinase [Lachnospiraceae bacterium]|nr:4-(cytidine 5'-diphospho)-2-C-methyl-D-erythritol kinase [Lachnospiraceae bacterium]